MSHQSEEVYTCEGCAGEVSVVEAVWLPELPGNNGKLAPGARPYCCKQCYEINPPLRDPRRKAMSQTTTPSKTITTCDCCRKEITNSYGGKLILQQSAHDFQGQPVADATVTRDLCADCKQVVSDAINASVCIGQPTTKIFRDGNKWCAVRPDFINLAESNAGFGDTQVEAILDLASQETAAGEKR